MSKGSLDQLYDTVQNLNKAHAEFVDKIIAEIPEPQIRVHPAGGDAIYSGETFVGIIYLDAKHTDAGLTFTWKFKQ